jgi:hypothetical protein
MEEVVERITGYCGGLMVNDESEFSEVKETAERSGRFPAPPLPRNVMYVSRYINLHSTTTTTVLPFHLPSFVFGLFCL